MRNHFENAGPRSAVQSRAQDFFEIFPERRADTFFIQLSDVSLAEGEALDITGLEKATAHLPDKHRDFARSAFAGDFHIGNPSLERVKWRDKPDKPPVYFVLIPPPIYDGKTEGENCLQSHVRAYPKSTQKELRVLLPGGADFDDKNYWWDCAFDHETAHVLEEFVPDMGRIPSAIRAHVSECFADSYALVRHFQRHGPDTGFAEAETAMRAFIAPRMHQSPKALIHMTAYTLSVLSSRDLRLKLSQTQPAQAAEAAMDVVRTACLNKAQLIALRDMGAECDQILQEQGFEAFLDWFAQETAPGRRNIPGNIGPLYFEGLARLGMAHGLKPVPAGQKAFPDQKFHASPA